MKSLARSRRPLAVTLTVTVIGIVAVVALYALFRWSRIGIAMRAVVDDADWWTRTRLPSATGVTLRRS